MVSVVCDTFECIAAGDGRSVPGWSRSLPTLSPCALLEHAANPVILANLSMMKDLAERRGGRQLCYLLLGEASGQALDCSLLPVSLLCAVLC